MDLQNLQPVSIQADSRELVFEKNIMSYLWSCIP